ncbi:MAG: translation initiation factor IF-2 [Kiritimatiellia bacterium]|jgi:translation initiation factor IF-2
MRVFELARELNVTSKELLERLRADGVEAKSHMSAIADEVAEKLRAAKAKKPAAPVPPKASAPSPVEPVAAAPSSPPLKQDAPPIKPPSAKPPPVKPKPAKTLPVERESQSAPTQVGRIVTVRGPIVVREFAELLGMKPNQLIAELMMMNVLASINEKLDIKTAQQVAEKHGLILEHERKPEAHPSPAAPEEVEEDRPEDLKPRPPVVTFMGHIDHGKTSLLDRIRKTAVASREAGGITQHIGAYTVEHNGNLITFLDTPGHAAFTAMRARGANLTDIAVIVIAADDGIMPQTEEAIKHAQAAGTTLMVAINKMDLPTARPDNVRRQLQAAGLTPEEWGGDLICCEVSAQTGAGIDNLLEMLLLQAEMLDLKANPSPRAEGYVVEAQMETGMGPTAHLIVTRGTLRVGDIVVCGCCWGRVKALINARGAKVRQALPSTPVKCMGLSAIPPAGEFFKVYPNERAARQLAEQRAMDQRDAQLAAPARKTSLENLFERMEASRRLELKLVLKCDTRGSLEAIQHVLSEIQSDKVHINIILTGVGGITENDVLLASASDAIIIGFNVGKSEEVVRAAKREGVEIRLYSIIYNIADEIREAMTGLLAPELREKTLGRAEVRQVFPITKTGKIAGCLVVSGRVRARSKVRVKRNGELLYEGAVLTLKRFQDEVGEVREGQECGVRLDNYSEFEPGDVLEFFEIEKIAAKL